MLRRAMNVLSFGLYYILLIIFQTIIELSI